MLNNTTGLSFGWAAALFGAAVVFAPACGGDNNGTGKECTPNQQIACDCPGGTKGVQVCNSDGRSFGACDCDGETGGSNTGGSSTGGTTTGTTKTGACGDGIPDPGECDGGEFACPQDCTGTGGTGGTTTTNTCSGFVTYAGLVTDAGPSWGAHAQSNGKTGYEAGIEICKTLGADHPCDYEEVKSAEAAGELADIAMGTTAWVHRVTAEMVNGASSPPGPGARCNDWTYITNHISDGEYITFDTVGVPTYHLDNDTVYDEGQPGAHTQDDLPCGGATRAILCCFPACL